MRESDRVNLGREGGDFYRRALEGAREHEMAVTKLSSLIPSEEMVWEESPQGRLKHMVNEWMATREFCLDVYQQVLEPGERSGSHRHFSEEILFVLEGDGFDLHWDPIFEADVEYEWRWEEEPRRFEWTAGDFVYVPPFAVHRHTAGPGGARLLSATSRIVKAMGFDGLEQVEPAERYREEARGRAEGQV
ncbi:MAG TPA: hypothetical protein VFN68_17345 [Acidimicrobiales bacterium]|nr:hypothetical protein [Acidimicrobiales bacterium]